MTEYKLRKRGKTADDYDRLDSSGDPMGMYGYNQSWKFPIVPCLLSLAVGFGVLMGIAMIADTSLPVPVLLQEAPERPGSFIGERAYKHLERLTSIGPRVTGSYENEVRAVDLLLREISFIKHFAKPIHRITVDVQKPSGVRDSVITGHDYSVIYHNLVNIVVKIEGNDSVDTSSEALLVGAHFDTVRGSPGKSYFIFHFSITLSKLFLSL